jgi:hypothetical protein
MVAQGYIDDSGANTTSSVFVLGGFIAPVDNWLAFSTDWKAALDAPPRLEYFKMKEAARLKDQFHPRRGWTEELRDQRINTLAAIIQKYAVLRVSVALRHSDFIKHLRSLPAVNRDLARDTPFVTALSLLMTAVAISREQNLLMEPIDFIFDQQEGIEEELAPFWPGIKRRSEKADSKIVRDCFRHMPLFRDEKDFLPLQAADLYAWQIRRNHHNNRSLYMPPTETLRRLWSIQGFDRFYSEAEIKVRADLERAMARKILALDPSVKWTGDHPDTKIRKANRKKAKRKPQKFKSS